MVKIIKELEFVTYKCWKIVPVKFVGRVIAAFYNFVKEFIFGNYDLICLLMGSVIDWKQV